MPRPGSHAYDVQRARLRNRIDDEGDHPDAAADERANQILQRDRGQEGRLRSERGLGPKSERERTRSERGEGES